MFRRWLNSWGSAGEDDVFTDSDSGDDDECVDNRYSDRNYSPELLYLLQKKQLAMNR